MKDIKIYLNSPVTDEHDSLNDYLIEFFKSISTENLTFSIKSLDFFDPEISIAAQVIDMMIYCDIIITNINENSNSNIFYEMGLAHGLAKPNILIAAGISILPDEFQGLGCIYYSPTNKKSLTIELEKLVFQFAKNPENFLSFRSMPNKNIQKKVFVSYNHKDSKYLDRLKVHIKPLERENLLELWSDTKIKGGEKWKVEIDNALKNSVIAILLISADFMASDFIVNNELPPLLRAAEDTGVIIIPLIVKPCRFTRDKNLSQFQAINDPLNPLCKLTEFEQEDIYEQLTQRIEGAINSLN